MVWALSWCDKTSCHYKMPECFFPALFVYLCLSLSLALSEHQYNLMQSILFTLKSNKSASACVLMNFAVAVSSLLLLFFFVCVLFVCPHSGSSDLYRCRRAQHHKSTDANCTHTHKQYKSVAYLLLPRNPFIPLSIDSLHNDLFLAIMYHQVLSSCSCALFYAL